MGASLGVAVLQSLRVAMMACGSCAGVQLHFVPALWKRTEWSECGRMVPQAWDEFLYGDLTGLDLSGKKVCWRRELRLREETQSGIRRQRMP